MDALLGTEIQNPQGLPRLFHSLSRRARRGHRGDGLHLTPKLAPEALLGNMGMPPAIGIPIPLPVMKTPGRSLTRLEALIAKKFTAVGREERIARSLAALHEPAAIRLTEEDRRWLDENSNIEDEFE